MGSKPFLKLQECEQHFHSIFTCTSPRIAALYSTEVVTDQSQYILTCGPDFVHFHYNQLAILAKLLPGYKIASETGHTQPLFYVVRSYFRVGCLK